MWDNLYKPGHLHGNWLDNNTQIISSVDIGSGTGWFVNYLKDKYNFKTIYGIEPSEAAIKIAKTIYQDNTNITYLTGYAEECLNKINVNEPTLFTTSIVLSHIEDNSVIQILKEMNKVAPVDSVFIFNENYENYDNTFHNYMWHCRTSEWWESNLPDWDIQYDERPRPDLQVYKQGLMGKKVK
jgi:trans-aconitate methyltransferase